MISFEAIAMSIAHERQDRERRIRRWMAMDRRAEAGSIRVRIGRRVIRVGERLASAPLAGPAA